MMGLWTRKPSRSWPTLLTHHLAAESLIKHYTDLLKEVTILIPDVDCLWATMRHDTARA